MKYRAFKINTNTDRAYKMKSPIITSVTALTRIITTPHCLRRRNNIPTSINDYRCVYKGSVYDGICPVCMVVERRDIRYHSARY